MQQIQLYIEDERVDLFEDESIVVTDSIKDLKDITKIYTAFSQQFNLPASKTNNKIFKHYYNYNIINGYDARLRKNATIKVNGVDYKVGKIQLNSVDLKDNKPHSYKVVFYGNTVALKDLIGDDLLEDLDLSAYNHDYDGTTQITGLQTYLFSGNIKYPLISHTKNFDVSTTAGVYEFGTANKPIYTDFKPALKLNAIINAISSKYNLTFGDNFFNSEYFDNLYLWLHRHKGIMRNADETVQLITNVFDFVYQSGGDVFSIVDLETFDNGYRGKRFKFTWDVSIAGSVDYQVKVIDTLTNETLLEQSANGTDAFTLYVESDDLRTWDLDFIVVSESTLGITQDLQITFQTRDEINDWDYVTVLNGYYDFVATNAENQVVIREVMPKFKVIDFITNLFKMHNLVAFVERDGVDEIIQVEDLPLYYNEFNTYDISKYVDVKQISIEKFYPYKEVSFEYTGQKTILTEALNDFKVGDDFGNLSYIDTNPQNKDAEKYEIKIDFEKVYFERLKYSDTGADSTIQWGYFVDKDQNPIVNKPLILMLENRSTSGDLEVNDGTTDQALATYNAPVNNKTLSGVVHSLNFGIELDEYTGDEIEIDSTLFGKYFKNYIQRIYHNQSRKMICTTYLPMHLVLNYTLKDTFIINGSKWKIESIKTNFLKQESKLTLYNDIGDFALASVGINSQAETVTDLTASNNGSTDIDLTWDSGSGVLQYIIYLNNQAIDTSSSKSYTAVVDNTKFSYNIGVQVEYTDGYKSKIKYITND